MAGREAIFASSISVYNMEEGIDGIVGIGRSELLNSRTNYACAQKVGASYRHYQQSAEKYCFILLSAKL